MAKIQLSLQLAELASSQRQPDLSGIPRCLHNHNDIVLLYIFPFDLVDVVKYNLDGIADCSKDLTLMY